MRTLSPEDEKRKKAIFNGMSPRRQKHVLKKGYDVWDPFVAPKDPIDIRRDTEKRTAVELTRTFLTACKQEDYSNAFGQGAWEICLGLLRDDDRYQGMYAFACWYRGFLEREDRK